MFLFLVVLTACFILVSLRKQQQKVGVLSAKSISLEKVKKIIADAIKLIGGLSALTFLNIPYLDNVVDFLTFVNMNVGDLWQAVSEVLTIGLAIIVYAREQFVKVSTRMVSAKSDGAKALSHYDERSLIL